MSSGKPTISAVYRMSKTTDMFALKQAGTESFFGTLKLKVGTVGGETVVVVGAGALVVVDLITY